MSPDLAPDRALAADRPAERRSHSRYGVELDLHYKLLWRQRVRDEGTGKTCDLSTGGIFFRADRSLPKGWPVELAIDWPMRLDGICPLQLRVMGKIVRSSETGTAVKITHHEFCTRRGASTAAGGP